MTAQPKKSPAKRAILYKILESGGASHFSEFSYRPYLPTGKPGDWTPSIKEQLQRCRRGYHLTDAPEHWLWYFTRPVVYVAEGKGERVYATQSRYERKRVFRSVRLLRRVTRDEMRAIRTGTLG